MKKTNNTTKKTVQHAPAASKKPAAAKPTVKQAKLPPPMAAAPRRSVSVRASHAATGNEFRHLEKLSRPGDARTLLEHVFAEPPGFALLDIGGRAGADVENQHDEHQYRLVIDNEDERWFQQHADDPVGLVGRGAPGVGYAPPRPVRDLFNSLGLRVTVGAVTAFAQKLASYTQNHYSVDEAIKKSVQEVATPDVLVNPDKYDIAFGRANGAPPPPSQTASESGWLASLPEERKQVGDRGTLVLMPETPYRKGGWVASDRAFQQTIDPNFASFVGDYSPGSKGLEGTRGTAVPLGGPAPAMSSLIGPNSTFIKALQTPYGEGVHLKGQLIVASLTSTADGAASGAGRLVAVGDAHILVPGTSNITIPSYPHSIAVRPASLGGRPAAFSRLYSRSHIHKMTFKYMPATTTTTVQGVAMSVVDDGLYNSLLTNGKGTPNTAVPEAELYGTLLANDNAVLGPAWAPLSVSFNMRGGMADLENWLYNQTPNDISTGGAGNIYLAEKRSMSAGTFTCTLDRISATAYTYGHIVCEYEIIFADPVADLSAVLPTQLLAVAPTGAAQALAQGVLADPVPMFRCLQAYGWLTEIEPKSVMDEEIERYLERIGLTSPRQIKTKYELWLLDQHAAALCLKKC
jgi:hypothetical protein